MQFMVYFIWGSWLITLSAYWFQNKHWPSTLFGLVFSTMAISSIFTPTAAGILADRYINAEYLMFLCNFIGAITLFILPSLTTPTAFFWVMLLYMIFYKPTLSLSASISYSALQFDHLDIINDYPIIRVWGTIGFVIALWTISLCGWEKSPIQFYVASAASLLLSLYSFSLPRCKPLQPSSSSDEESAISVSERCGVEAFQIFRSSTMCVFFLFTTLLGAALQLTNAYGDTFLHDFAHHPEYSNSLVVSYPAIFMSISQISEICFILTIPTVYTKCGIKITMSLSMFAWVIRFGCFAYANPTDRLLLIIISCIAYGAAFDFFLISGSLFIDSQVENELRASAQGLFMCFVGGIGPLLGNFFAGWMISVWFIDEEGKFEWRNIWLSFAAYSLFVALSFIVMFHYPNDDNDGGGGGDLRKNRKDYEIIDDDDDHS